ncbi:hypothetical protein E0K89_012985 [Aquicoccus sp. SCR17]|nr:hypothetical protein [Carideicomes alvinocaridis]
MTCLFTSSGRVWRASSRLWSLLNSLALKLSASAARGMSKHLTAQTNGDELKERADRDGVPYERWRDAGLITATPGPIIDAEVIEDHLRELSARHDVQEIAFDPHLARQMMQRLHEDGLPVVEMRQAPLTMGVAAGDLERVVNGRLIRHDGHPVLRQHFDSVVASRNETTGLTRMPSTAATLATRDARSPVRTVCQSHATAARVFGSQVRTLNA